MNEHISWQEYFMGVAILSSYRSKDPNTKVGACIVTPENRIIGTGYNGFPVCKNGDADKQFPWTKHSANELENKYYYVVHAEPNAILNSTASTKNCTMYLTWFPCAECTKLIIQSGITKIVYLKEHTTDRYRTSMMASKKMLDLAGIHIEKISINNKEIILSYKENN